MNSSNWIFDGILCQLHNLYFMIWNIELTTNPYRALSFSYSLAWMLILAVVEPLIIIMSLIAALLSRWNNREVLAEQARSWFFCQRLSL